jgi:putative two-component system response regulator
MDIFGWKGWSNMVEALKGKVLVVDDEVLIRKLLCQILTKEGYDCDEAAGANDASNKIATGLFDLVISDIRMPGRSGMELLTSIKASYPDIAVIMATGLVEIDVAVECLKRGADDYICKPFDLEQVKASVQRSLDKRRIELMIKKYQEDLELKVERQTEEIRKLSLGAIEALVIALEAKDKYTAGHSRRVSEISLAVAKEMGLSKEEIEDLRWGSLLHDVGKIAVDQMIQNKPGNLTTEEYEHIMVHAQVGAGIVKPVVNSTVVGIVEHHHDHFDGKRSHQELYGKAIPLGARILAVADAFDAMTSDRPYRHALPAKESLAEIKRCSGSQFDPDIVKVFLKLFTPEGAIPRL